MHSCSTANSITICVVAFSPIRKYKLLIMIPNVWTDIGVLFALLKQSPESTGIKSKQWKERVLPPDPCGQVSDDQTKMKKGFVTI